MAFLTDRTLTTGVSTNDLIHIVITGDTSQNPAGSSYKATMGQVLDLINPTTLTGGTYNPLTGTITFYDDTGGSFNVTGLVTGYTNTAVTGLTYDNANTFTILENDGTTHSASFNIVTGLTVKDKGGINTILILGLRFSTRLIFTLAEVMEFSLFLRVTSILISVIEKNRPLCTLEPLFLKVKGERVKTS